jgi:hypothetical protein
VGADLSGGDEMQNCKVCKEYIDNMLNDKFSDWCYKYKGKVEKVKPRCELENGFEEDVDAFKDIPREV